MVSGSLDSGTGRASENGHILVTYTETSSNTYHHVHVQMAFFDRTLCSKNVADNIEQHSRPTSFNPGVWFCGSCARPLHVEGYRRVFLDSAGEFNDTTRHV